MPEQESKIAVVATYASGILGAICSIGALVIRSYPRIPTWVETTLWVSGLVFLLVAVSVYGYLERRQLRKALASRQAQHASNTAALIAVLAGILVMVNFLASRHHQRWDLTQNKNYSLSEQTRKILKNLAADIAITSFYSLNNPSGQQVRDLLNEYQYASSHIKFEAIDPERNPGKARAAGITRETVVMETQGRKQEVAGYSEQDFTSGLLKLIRPTPKVVYFLQGHGEHDPDDGSPNGLGNAKSSLEKQNYKIDKLILALKPEVPQNASVLVIAGPARQMLPAERQALDRYINGGGKLLLLLNPRVETGLEDLAKRFGVVATNDLVVDLKSHFFIDAGTPLIVTYRFHEVTHNLSMSYFPGVRSLAISDKPVPGVTTTQLALTSDRSYGLANIQARGQISIDAKRDHKGPLAIAVAIDYTPPTPTPSPGSSPSPRASASPSPTPSVKPPKAHLVIFGNSTFATNSLFNNVSNGDFFLNCVNWLAEEEELIAIAPKPPDQRRIDMSNNQWRIVSLFSIFALPLLMAGIGGVVWWRRR